MRRTCRNCANYEEIAEESNVFWCRWHEAMISKCMLDADAWGCEGWKSRKRKEKLENQIQIIKELTEKIVNSSVFQQFCDFACPFKSEGCRHRCSIFAFRIWLNGRNEK